jgi:DNA end-binding protein Ku
LRTIWNGAISFGLVTIPVGLAPATKPKARQSDVSFRTLHRECGTPIKQKRWCPFHEREVSADEVVKGWEVAKGQFVIVEDADLESLEQQTDGRAIEIAQFVKVEEVDPIFFDRTYYLLPGAAPAARKPYALLLQAMTEMGVAALGRMVMRGTEYICLIRPRGDALALETLFLAEDVYSQAEITEAVSEASVKKPELELARQVIEGLVAEFDPSQLTSDYRRDLRAMLEAKLAGEEPTRPEPVGEDAPVIDLMEALRRSVAEAQERGPAAAKAPTRQRRRAASRKS